jgi:hypothetical protein
VEKIAPCSRKVRDGCSDEDGGRKKEALITGGSFERCGTGLGVKIAIGSQSNGGQFGQLRNGEILTAQSVVDHEGTAQEQKQVN